jgi:hypothetical protein
MARRASLARNLPLSALPHGAHLQIPEAVHRKRSKRSLSFSLAAASPGMVAEDNAVRAVDVFVDGLDLDKLGFVGVQPLDTGRPGYHHRRFGSHFSSFTTAVFSRPSATGYYVWFVLIFVRSRADPIGDLR